MHTCTQACIRTHTPHMHAFTHARSQTCARKHAYEHTHTHAHRAPPFHPPLHQSWPCRLALYVPSATALTSGGYFLPRAPASSAQANGKPSPVSTQEGGAAGAPPPAPAGSPDTSYDTLISAQHILLGMQQVGLPGKRRVGLCSEEGLAPSAVGRGPSRAVQAAVALVACVDCHFSAGSAL